MRSRIIDTITHGLTGIQCAEVATMLFNSAPNDPVFFTIPKNNADMFMRNLRVSMTRYRKDHDVPQFMLRLHGPIPYCGPPTPIPAEIVIARRVLSQTMIFGDIWESMNSPQEGQHGTANTESA